MPHTKRKGTLRGEIVSSPAIDPRQLQIPGFFSVPGPLIPESSVAKGLVEEHIPPPLTLDITLSPGSPKKPSYPGDIDIPSPVMATAAAETSDKPELVMTSTPETYGAANYTSLLSKERGERTVVDGKDEQLRALTVSSMIKKSDPITMEGIWSILKSIESSIKVLSQVTLETKQQTMINNEIITRFSAKTESLESKITVVEKNQVKLIESEISTSKRLEAVENSLRAHNLRIINFPVIKDIAPLNLFRTYMQQILKIPEAALPVVVKAYYLHQVTQMEEPNLALNLTDILEQSLELEISQRKPLLISFAFLSERNNILRMFFRNRQAKFYGFPIWVYPDVVKSTQQRRKEFLSLRADLIKIGARFTLKYPCRACILYKSNNYIFLEPKQLKEFLVAHSPQVSAAVLE
ncbi:uncharacterized protein LOC115098582 [Rhinatrema bivittatum]|uniref:uncharacterized protein LOC115098582 n=1 Tax=Rhinatrema bivittatum TaxID=194408 RepID=UPI00112954FB|nr:uncharacterized protein LOC115098582 [Rhinatrema bivittatum]